MERQQANVVRRIMMENGGPKTALALQMLARAALQGTGAVIVDGGYRVGTTFIPANELALTMWNCLIIVNFILAVRKSSNS